MDTTATLRQENAPRYQSMDGRLYRPLLDGLAHMGYECAFVQRMSEVNSNADRCDVDT